MSRKTNGFFCRRTHAQNEHGFTFLETIKVHMRRMPSFCKLKMLRHAQIQIVVSKMFQKMAVPFFTNANGTQTFFSIKMFFSTKMGVGPEGPGKRKALAPHFLEKTFLLKRTFVYRLRL